jgi:hypothetical protein
VGRRPRTLAGKLLAGVLAATGVLLVVSLALALTSTDQATPASGITGQVMTDQCRPVDQVGDPPCPPYEGPIRILRTDQTLVVIAQTDRAGRFRVELPPGLYIVDPNDEGLSVSKGYGRVTVREGEFSDVDLSHSVGLVCLLGRTWMHMVSASGTVHGRVIPGAP